MANEFRSLGSLIAHISARSIVSCSSYLSHLPNMVIDLMAQMGSIGVSGRDDGLGERV